MYRILQKNILYSDKKSIVVFVFRIGLLLITTLIISNGAKGERFHAKSVL